VDGLRITEIFHSLQGESSLTGLPTVFIRLTGCPLRCNYCDTEYAFSGGERMSINDIMASVAELNCRRVCVTGGEPLSQRGCYDLLTALCDAGYTVSLETSGAIEISEVDPRVIKIMDLKTPNSGEMVRNKYENLQYLLPQDQLKFVICTRRDYDWAKLQLVDRDIPNIAEILFSPSFEQVEAADLAQWILDDGLDVRMQIQMHKVLWGEKKGV